LQFRAIEDFGIDHADQQFFDRALTEPVDNAFDGAAGHALAGFCGAI
jgi:hypothetical protein